MSDPIVAARALLQNGDVAGAERVLSTSIMSGAVDVHRAVRALIAICLHSGEVSFRAQQAFESFMARPVHSDEDSAAVLTLARLYRELGILDAALESYDTWLASRHDPGVRAERDALAPAPLTHEELPSLDGFGAPVVVDIAATDKQERPRSLSDVALELTGGSFDVDIDMAKTEPAPPQPVPSAPVPVPAAKAAPVAVAGLGPAAPGTPATPQSNKSKPASQSGGPPPIVLELFRPGAVIGTRYEIEARIGRGGHATVFRVHDRTLDERCALKVFHNTGEEADLARFKREVSLSRRVVHEHVVKLYDIGEEQGFWFLTMELLEGQDLASLVKKTLPDLATCLHLMQQACRGLHAAHKNGIVHRDVKPGNLFVQHSGPLKVMDFGIAKPADATALTQTGIFMGTPQFVAPEQVQGLEVSARTDIYSLGVILYLLATGTLPFQDKEMVPLLMKHITTPPDPPSARNPTLPALLDALILGCLAKKPKDRPTDCVEVDETIEEILELVH